MTRKGKRMRESTKRLLAMMLGLTLAATGLETASSQSRPDPKGDTQSPSRSGLSGHERAAPIEVSDYVTQSIVSDIRAVRLECDHYEPGYRLDCLKQGFDLVARRIPRSGAYAPVRTIIEQASRDLGRIVAANADHNQALQPSTGNPRFKARRRFTAIRQDTLKSAFKQAEAVIREAETQLLRSTENSEKRAIHFQQVSAAIGSAKVLLRS